MGRKRHTAEQIIGNIPLVELEALYYEQLPALTMGVGLT